MQLLSSVFQFNECISAHYGLNPGNHVDRLINDEEVRNADNVLLLQVTATPYNLVTMNSRWVDILIV